MKIHKTNAITAIILFTSLTLNHLSPAFLAVWGEVVSVYGLLAVSIADAVASRTLAVVVSHVKPIGKMLIVSCKSFVHIFVDFHGGKTISTLGTLSATSGRVFIGDHINYSCFFATFRASHIFTSYDFSEIVSSFTFHCQPYFSMTCMFVTRASTLIVSVQKDHFSQGHLLTNNLYIVHLRSLTALIHAILAIIVAVYVVIIITVHYVDSTPDTLCKYRRCRSIGASRGTNVFLAIFAHYLFLLIVPIVIIQAIVNTIPTKKPSQNGLTNIIFTSKYNL